MAKDITEMDLGIIVDDGSVRVPIKNNVGEEIGVFYFRPTDIGIIDRYNKMAGKFDEITAPLENLSLTADGTTDEAELEALREAEKRLYDALDEMFGGNMAEAFFGKMNPFSPVNGNFYCESAIQAVGAFISRQFKIETERLNKRVGKYIKNYQKGKTK